MTSAVLRKLHTTSSWPWNVHQFHDVLAPLRPGNERGARLDVVHHALHLVARVKDEDGNPSLHGKMRHVPDHRIIKLVNGISSNSETTCRAAATPAAFSGCLCCFFFGSLSLSGFAALLCYSHAPLPLTWRLLNPLALVACDACVLASLLPTLNSPRFKLL